MVDIKKVLGKDKEYEIAGEKVTLSPLRVANLDMLLSLGKDSDKKEAIHSLLVFYGRSVFPEATDEEIASLKVSVAAELLEAIMDVNGLKEDAHKE